MNSGWYKTRTDPFTPGSRGSSGSTVQFAWRGLCSSFSSCRKRKARRWSRLKKIWWTKKQILSNYEKSNFRDHDLTVSANAGARCAGLDGGFAGVGLEPDEPGLGFAADEQIGQWRSALDWRTQ